MDWSSSFWIVARSASVFVSFAALIAFSFIVFRMSMEEESAPAAVLSRLPAFCAFWLSCARPRSCARMRSEIA